MQVKAEHLIATLRRTPLPIVWLSGDEPLLLLETADALRHHARETGYTEREVLEAGGSFSWNSLRQAGSSMSLFGDRKLIELRLPALKLDQAARDALVDYAAAAQPDDNLLLISSPRVDRTMAATKWFKAVEQKAAFVALWPVGPAQLPQWMGQRLRSKGLEADEETLRLLAERVEGNLLAAAQEVEKLALLKGGGRLSLEEVAEAVADHARFNVFGLIDAALAGDAARSTRMLTQLRAEGGDTLQILSLLLRELRALARMRAHMSRGQGPGAAMQAERVWQNRQAVVGRALSHLDERALEALFAEALRVDRAVKGLSRDNPWERLGRLVLRMAGVALPREA